MLAFLKRQPSLKLGVRKILSPLEAFSPKQAAPRVRSTLDFTGRWTRYSSQVKASWSLPKTNNSACLKGLINYLKAHGFSLEKATAMAQAPYIQSWTRPPEIHVSENAWRVLTYSEDGKTPRRDVIYSIGIFKESYDNMQGGIFGGPGK
jgi:hypothetical protein